MKSPIILRIFKDNQLVDVKQFESDQVILGHDADVNIDLPDSQVSPIHCLVEKRDSGYYLCDMGSQSGTFLNGKQILDEALNSGDEIQVGPFKIVFFSVTAKPKTVPQQSSSVASQSNVPPMPEKDKNYEPAQPVQKSFEPVVVQKVPEVIPTEIKSVQPETKKVEVKKVQSHAKSKKHQKTFAPASQIPQLKEYIKPQKGTLIEVIVGWKDRIIGSYHLADKKGLLAGQDGSVADIPVPSRIFSKPFPLVVKEGQIARVNIPNGFKVSLSSGGSVLNEDQLSTLGRIIRSGSGNSIRVDQSEVICIEEENISFFIRYIPATKRAVLAPMVDLSGGEATGVIVSLVLVSLLALWISIYQPKPIEEAKEDEVQRIATFVYNKLPATPTPAPTPEPPKQEVVKVQPTPPPKKVEVRDTDKQATVKSNKPDNTNRQKQVAASKASEVRPIPNSKNRPKSFTSTKQGGSVKTSDAASANAQSNRDMSKVGLFSAFGGGGNRAQLDQAYSGSGELLGMADKATGTSGMNEDRAGNDLGSKFKDTGAGGKGTATQGIAGVGTQGRGGGTSAYGSGSGLGGKDAVSVEGGGFEEEWVGSIDREAVRRVVRAGLKEVRACYEKELNRNPGIEGKVVIEWDIGEQGKVLAAKVKSTSLDNSSVESCIVARLKTWRFPEPPPNLVATVSYPFTLVSRR